MAEARTDLEAEARALERRKSEYIAKVRQTNRDLHAERQQLQAAELEALRSKH